ncbi:unnamed protein product [Camellia sinensis]
MRLRRMYLNHIESIVIMRFMKGSKVEVLSKKEVSTGSWLSAEIISGNGHTYSIRYVSFPSSGEALVERVPRKAIRPCPPPVEGAAADNWVPGDRLEVFHSKNMSWKTATMVKVLGGNKFLVRLIGKSKEFEVHGSHLRVRQSWQDDKWFIVGKGDAQFAMSMKKNQKDTNTKLFVGKDHFHAAKKMEIQEPQNSTRTLEKASPIGGNSVKHENEDTDSFRSDAEPFHGRWYEKEGSDLVKNKELVARDHKLELRAYCNALKALFASGPLSWEDEMEVTELRLSLHISDDEHLVEIRNLMEESGDWGRPKGRRKSPTKTNITSSSLRMLILYPMDVVFASIISNKVQLMLLVEVTQGRKERRVVNLCCGKRFEKGWTIILTSLGAIAMPKMLNDGAVEYEDGTPTTVTGN